MGVKSHYICILLLDEAWIFFLLVFGMHSDAVKRVQRCYIDSFFMQWNLLHNPLLNRVQFIFEKKKNFRILIYTLNINYILRRSYVLSLHLSPDLILIFSHISLYVFLFNWLSVCPSVCQSVYLTACFSFFSLISFSEFLTFFRKIKIKHVLGCRWIDASIHNFLIFFRS